MELTDITFTEGQNNTPGIAAMMFMKFTDCSIIPDLVNPAPETSGDAADFVTVTGDIILKANKTPISVYFTDETANYKYKLQGAMDSKSFKNSIEFMTPNKAVGLAAFLTAVKNGRGLVLLLTKGGQTLMMGGPRFPVRVDDVDGSFGGPPTDASSAKSILYVNDTVPWRYFEGAVMYGSNGGSGSGAAEYTLFAN